MTEFLAQLRSLDPDLFSYVEAQTSPWDRRALLALQVAAGDLLGKFRYLEIGSYMGGSLQAVMRDPRCLSVTSIDTRPDVAPDVRGDTWEYADNSTEHMLDGLRELPDVCMDKLVTFDSGTDSLRPEELPSRPDYCFIDGEHTVEAVLRDAEFCAEALDGNGVISFHDYSLVGPAISVFLRRHWSEISRAVAFTGSDEPSAGSGVLALELGDRGFLKHPAVKLAIGSCWHSIGWRIASLSRRHVEPFLLAWALIPALDSFVARARFGLEQYVRSAGDKSGGGQAP